MTQHKHYKMHHNFIVTLSVIGICATFLYFFGSNMLRKTTTTELSTYKDEKGAFSFKYPKGLFAITEPQVDGAGWVTFYLNSYAFEASERCEKLNLGTTDRPCGYGDIVFEVFVNDNTDINRLDTKTMSLKRVFVDSKRREWKIYKDLPWTGSLFNMQGVDAYTKMGERVLSISIIHPEYQFFYNDTVENTILSSFELSK